MKNFNGLGAARTGQIIGTVLAIATVLSLLFLVVLSDARCRQTKDCGSYQSPSQTSQQQSFGFVLWHPTDAVGFYTMVLSVFTGALVLVSALQGYFLLRADRTARTAADAALTTAQAAIIQAEHMRTSVGEAARTAAAMEKIANAARLAFLDLEKPILSVRVTAPNFRIQANGDLFTDGLLDWEIRNYSRFPISVIAIAATAREFSSRYDKGGWGCPPVPPRFGRGEVMAPGVRLQFTLSVVASMINAGFMQFQSGEFTRPCGQTGSGAGAVGTACAARRRCGDGGGVLTG